MWPVNRADVLVLHSSYSPWLPSLPFYFGLASSVFLYEQRSDSDSVHLWEVYRVNPSAEVTKVKYGVWRRSVGKVIPERNVTIKLERRKDLRGKCAYALTPLTL